MVLFALACATAESVDTGDSGEPGDTGNSALTAPCVAVTLNQGEDGTFGSLTAYQLMAMQGGNNHRDDFGGQMESWVVVRR